jgi:hypothetical protein
MAQCFRLASVDHGPLPNDYQLRIGSICKFPEREKPPEATWNAETKCWVLFRWEKCADPTKAGA